MYERGGAFHERAYESTAARVLLKISGMLTNPIHRGLGDSHPSISRVHRAVGDDKPELKII